MGENQVTPAGRFCTMCKDQPDLPLTVDESLGQVARLSDTDLPEL